MIDVEGRSICEIVGRYVKLTRAGKEFVGLCPFHSENTPSCYVHPEKGLFHCFGCGIGGDVIRFIERIEGVDFKGALEILGLTDEFKPPQEQIERRAERQATGDKILAWSQKLSQRINCRLLLNFQRQGIAKDCDRDLHRELICEFEALSALQDSLADADQRILQR